VRKGVVQKFDFLKTEKKVGFFQTFQTFKLNKFIVFRIKGIPLNFSVLNMILCAFQEIFKFSNFFKLLSNFSNFQFFRGIYELVN